MSNAQAFGNAWIAAITDIINDIQTLRLMQDRATQETTLLQNYLTASGRTDIAIADLQAAFANINSLIAAFDAGNPPTKAAIYKVLNQ